jgi:glycosyltransferase involved in cell wall biosynthesis
MKISIVIPVYNEADCLKACLDSIAKQTIKPYEVIVVDNNSSDDSLNIARSYGFTKVLIEKRQGVVHARTTGFDKASGDIIARIDGDTILPPDWLANVTRSFKDNPKTHAVSGAAEYYGVAYAKIFNAIDLYLRSHLRTKLKDRLYLWGANMAMTNESWRAVKPHLCQKGGQHEDYDIAIHMQEIGYNVVFDERLKAEVSSRRIDSDFISFMKYVLVSPRTYKQHKLKVMRHFVPAVSICAIGYLPALLMHKGYDPDTGKFSFSYLASSSNIARVDPTANVV